MGNYCKNDHGIALLTVMVIMTVIVIVSAVTLRMVSYESRAVYDYGNNIRAYHIAESGADVVIMGYESYIKKLYEDELKKNIDPNDQEVSLTVNINGDLVKAKDDNGLDYFPMVEMLKEIVHAYDLSTAINELNIEQQGGNLVVSLPDEDTGSDIKLKLTFSPIGELKAEDVLTIESIGSYDDAEAKVLVRLSFTNKGSVKCSKGEGEQSDVGDEPSPTQPPVSQDTPEDQPFPWVDKNLNNVFDSGDLQLGLSDIKGAYATKGKLIIPTSVGELNAGNNYINYQADKGIFLGVSLSNTSNKSIKMQSANGDITLAKAITVTPSNELSIKASNGNIKADDTELNSISKGNIILTAKNNLSINNTKVVSSNKVDIAGNKISAINSVINSSSNGLISLTSTGINEGIDIQKAKITSSDKIDIVSSGIINAAESNLISSSNGFILLKANTADEDIILNNASVDSSGGATVESKGTLQAKNAKILSASNAGTSLMATNEINLTRASLPASGFLNITAGDDIISDYSGMSSTGGNDIYLKSNSNVSVQYSDINASGHLVITAGTKKNDIKVTGLRLIDSDNIARAYPDKVDIIGNPVLGSIYNGK